MKTYCYLIFCCLFLWTFAVDNAAAFPVPKDNSALLKNAHYSEAQSEYATALAAAEKVLDKKSFAKLEKELAAMITGNTQALTAAGESAQTAWIDAYSEAADYAKAEARFEFFRKNPVMAQGYYNAENGYDGYLLLEKQKNTEEYFLEFSLVQKGGAFNSGKLKAVSKKSDKKDVLLIFAENVGDGAIIGEILLKGETITVKTTDDFKTSGYLGHGVMLDGNYIREKK